MFCSINLNNFTVLCYVWIVTPLVCLFDVDFRLKLAQCILLPDVRVCICVQSVKTCGDDIFPSIKRTIMIQPLLCRKLVCVGVKGSVTMKVH